MGVLPPRAVAECHSVLKFQGVYRDRELYNYEVGCQYQGANWTGKTRPRRQRYSAVDLEKLRLSVSAGASVPLVDTVWLMLPAVTATTRCTEPLWADDEEEDE